LPFLGRGEKEKERVNDAEGRKRKVRGNREPFAPLTRSRNNGKSGEREERESRAGTFR